MEKKHRQYPHPEELDANREQLEKINEAKEVMESAGLEVPSGVLEKIEELSLQTKEKLPKWVTKPEWIEKLEDLQEGLTGAIERLEGIKGTKGQIASLQKQLAKVEKTLDQPREYLHGMSKKQYAQTISGEPEAKKGKKELSPEEAEEILSKVESRFNSNTNLHKGVEWTEVKASLEADSEALWSLSLMEAAGHEPDVYHDDKDSYWFGTCSKESPQSARNCVYDKEAADWLKENHPDVKFNGSAVEMAEAMGITLMMPEHYREVLQKKGQFDKETWSWLLTQSDIRSTGVALNGDRSVVFVDVNPDLAYLLSARGAWRGSLRVKKVMA